MIFSVATVSLLLQHKSELFADVRGAESHHGLKQTLVSSTFVCGRWICPSYSAAVCTQTHRVLSSAASVHNRNLDCRHFHT